MALHLVELQGQDDAERVALAVEAALFERIVHLVEWDIAGLGPEGLEEVAGDGAAGAADLDPGEIGGGMDRAGAGGQVMKAVLQAVAERMNPVLRQLAADALAEPAVEGGEHRLRVG